MAVAHKERVAVARMRFFKNLTTFSTAPPPPPSRTYGMRAPVRIWRETKGSSEDISKDFAAL